MGGGPGGPGIYDGQAGAPPARAITELAPHNARTIRLRRNKRLTIPSILLSTVPPDNVRETRKKHSRIESDAFRNVFLVSNQLRNVKLFFCLTPLWPPSCERLALLFITTLRWSTRRSPSLPD